MACSSAAWASPNPADIIRWIVRPIPYTVFFEPLGANNGSEHLQEVHPGNADGETHVDHHEKRDATRQAGGDAPAGIVMTGEAGHSEHQSTFLRLVLVEEIAAGPLSQWAHGPQPW